MTLLGIASRAARRSVAHSSRLRLGYASIAASMPPSRPGAAAIADSDAHLDPLPDFDRELLAHVSHLRRDSLPGHLAEYSDNAGRVLDTVLPYESRPNASRTLRSEDPDVVLVAHCANGPTPEERGITLASGFAINCVLPGREGESVFVTCAHTLEQIHRRHPQAQRSVLDAFVGTTSTSTSGSFIVSESTSPAGSSQQHHISPISSVPSSLPWSDLLLLSATTSYPSSALRTWPLSPYPASVGTKVRAHFVSYTKPRARDGEDWIPWIGGTYRKWVSGTVLGYRDRAGSETQPGTYDSLVNMLFSPPPTPGSSGGPIVDEETGAVVGVMRGTIMDNHIHGTRGWAVPAEAIYEMFKLPGLP